MSEEIDPTSSEFEIRAVSGDEALLCAQCGSTFELAYADALRNRDASWPSDSCCRSMLTSFIQKLFDMEADAAITGESVHMRRAAVQMRNHLRK